MPALEIGKPAPSFDLPASDGTRVKLADLRDQTVILYFYPKADTSGCTTQACAFRDAIGQFKKTGAVILGVSPDPVKAVTKFAEKYALPFLLLADEDHAACDKYGVWAEKCMYGRKYWGALRTTFIIRDSKIANRFAKVKPATHFDDVLTWLRENPTAAHAAKR